MSSDFKVGDEVVCINVDPLDSTTFPENLTKLTSGMVYTITKLNISKGTNIPVVMVKEIGGDPPAWWEACRFRKVQKKFTGMEVLTGLLLIPTKELEHAL